MGQRGLGSSAVRAEAASESHSSGKGTAEFLPSSGNSVIGGGGGTAGHGKGYYRGESVCFDSFALLSRSVILGNILHSLAVVYVAAIGRMASLVVQYVWTR